MGDRQSEATTRRAAETTARRLAMPAPLPSVPLPPPVEELADRPSLAPRGLIARARAAGLAVGAAATIGGLALGWAHVERRLPVLRRVDVPVAARPGLQPLTILHISDLHLYEGQRFIVDFLRGVAAHERFDFVVSTGDNLGDADGEQLVSEAYEPLLAYPGAFVLGSNDYYSPRRREWATYMLDNEAPRDARFTAAGELRTPDLPWLELVRRLRGAGWIDLTNQAATVDVAVEADRWDDARADRTGTRPAGAVEDEGGPATQRLSLIGVDDPHIERDRVPELPEGWGEADALRLALTHAPYRRVLDRFAQDGADLILAGHTHGGQVRLPGIGALVVNCDLPREYARGLHTWNTGEDRAALHVSAGLGTSPFAPIRFDCRPEATLLRIVPA